jgi:hypothetical protein
VPICLIHFTLGTREPLHHLSTTRHIIIEIHARVVCLSINGHIMGMSTGSNYPAKKDTNPETDNPNNDNE